MDARLWRVVLMTVLMLAAAHAVVGERAGAQAARVAAHSEVLTHSPLANCEPVQLRTPARARVATWNIRAARSAPLADIARELQSMQVDIVALQEVDMRTRRTGFVDETAALAGMLRLHHVFAASIEWDEGDYGLALLSRWPLTDVRRHRLDVPTASEPRIVLEAGVCVDGRPLRLFNHHADDRPASGAAGLALVRTLLQPRLGSGFLLLGDFNEPPDGPGVRGLVAAGLVDTGAALDEPTVFDRRIDYILADPQLAPHVSASRVWATTRSDHRAVLAHLQW